MFQRSAGHSRRIVRTNDRVRRLSEVESCAIHEFECLPPCREPGVSVNVWIEAGIFSYRTLGMMIDEEKIAPSIEAAIPAWRKDVGLFVCSRPEVRRMNRCDQSAARVYIFAVVCLLVLELVHPVVWQRVFQLLCEQTCVIAIGSIHSFCQPSGNLVTQVQANIVHGYKSNSMFVSQSLKYQTGLLTRRKVWIASLMRFAKGRKLECQMSYLDLVCWATSWL